MLFTSATFFFIYLPITLALFAISRHSPWVNTGLAVLAVMSLVFYGYWDASFVPLLMFSILWNYLAGLALDTERIKLPVSRRTIVTIAIVVNLCLLGYYKYANFFVQSVSSLTGANWKLLEIVLPLGISFFTFTQIAYVADTYKSGKPERSFIAYVLFVTFFPHLIAGPVLHHSEMMPQFHANAGKRVDPALALEGGLLFLLGLAKKVLIADSVAPTANRAFLLSDSGQLGFVDSWGGALAYTAQIYFDFSGYSDMAIGLGLLFGIRLPLNFNSPYRCTSIIDFWRCWHMTLSRFLRDYLYIVLGGNRHGATRRQINLMLTMLLGGLWHGASWTFVVWGGLHGLYLQINHYWRQFRGAGHGKDKPAKVSAVETIFGWALTFLAVVVAWVFFRAETFTSAWNMLQGMFLGAQTYSAQVLDSRVAVYLVIAFAIAVIFRNTQEILETRRPAIEALAHSPKPLRQGLAWGAIVGLSILLVLVAASRGTTEFIYFNF